METENKLDFSTPHEVSDVNMAFPARVVGILMPSYEDCTEGLKALGNHERGKWVEFQRKWFYDGLPETTQVHTKPGIDSEKAFRHLICVQGSFEPKHEHKESAVAYLASLWFEDVEYD